MPHSPNRLSRFWQELKRRKVIYVITVYASAAFVIIELVNNVGEPLNLPERTSTIVIVIPAIGFPIAIILSWIFDLTPKGIEKTKSLGEEEESEVPVVQNRWKIATYISLVVIIGLIIFNLVGGSTRLKAGDIQSLVILPFENYTGDDQLEYFVSGMHASLIQDMGRISGYRVVNRTSSKAYKNVDMRVQEIASELNTDAAIEADVMCLGDSICLQIRVIRAFPEEETIWISDYKEDKSQILNLYNKITKQIADEIMIELTPEEKRLLAKSRTVDLEAYDDYMKGFQYIGDYGLESLNKAKEFYNSAIEKDPDWAPLYSGLAGILLGLQHLGFESPSVASPKIYGNLNKALELDPDLSDAHVFKAAIAHWMEWDWEKSEKEFLRALAINPNDATARIWYAQLLGCLQRPDEALQQGQLAFELDPQNPLIKCWYGALLDLLGDCETALSLAEEVVAVEPEHSLANGVIWGTAFSCGDYDKVIESEKYWLQMDGGEQFDKNTFKEIERIYDEQGFDAAYREIVKQYEGFTSYSIDHPVCMANIYVNANQLEKAMNLLVKGFEMHDPQMIYITVYQFDPLFDNPQFIDIVEKMNLPLPTSN